MLGFGELLHKKRYRYDKLEKIKEIQDLLIYVPDQQNG